jgi:malonate transporter and related proteins
LDILGTILGALLPMVVSILLGFVAAWRHDFGSEDASTLNRMVLQYAVPLTLFTGTVMTSRKALSQDLPLVITLCVGIIGFYYVVFLFSRLVLHMQVSSSALASELFGHEKGAFTGALQDVWGGLNPLTARRSSSMKSAISRWTLKSHCCACCRSASLSEWEVIIRSQ